MHSSRRILRIERCNHWTWTADYSGAFHLRVNDSESAHTPVIKIPKPQQKCAAVNFYWKPMRWGGNRGYGVCFLQLVVASSFFFCTAIAGMAAE